MNNPFLKIANSYSSFVSKNYINEYYSRIGFENRSLLKFFHQAYKNIPKQSKLLEFGGGPTIYQLISASKYVSEIYFSDFLKENIECVKKWKEYPLEQFDWKNFIKSVLELEEYKNISHKDIQTRQDLIRKKITTFCHCDAYKKDPLGTKYRNYFELVGVNFVPESITHSKQVWSKLIKNITSLIKHDGFLILTSLKNAHYWHVTKLNFPAAFIDENDIRHELNNLNFSIISMSSIPAEGTKGDTNEYHGYEGMIFTKAKKNS